MVHVRTPEVLDALKPQVRAWAQELGFADLAFAPVTLMGAEQRLMDWLAAGYQGEMDYMSRHGAARARPAVLMPEVGSILVARLDYLPAASDPLANLAEPNRAYVSRYALGRDYHKLIRTRLQRLAQRLAEVAGPFVSRPFADSAPIMEVELARAAGLGWEGKHTLTLTRGGSWFFLGELFCDLPFRPDAPVANHCGTCRACLDACPTGAIVAPHVLDARRCISYLTIELDGPIPAELRPLMGNRIYGCDDCQLYCPWNRRAQTSQGNDGPPRVSLTPSGGGLGAARPWGRSVTTDFAPRQGLDTASLLELFAWSEADFLSRLEGSPIRRIGHERWLRNVAVALGNAPPNPAIRAALAARLPGASALLTEHLEWALSRQTRTP